MKKLSIIIIIIMLSASSFMFAQTIDDIDLDGLIGAFDEFSEVVANSLPFYSSIGLTWSDAYIGQFPNFGLGITLGATTIPWEATEAVSVLFGIDFRDYFPDFLTQFGYPYPAYTIDARLGGFGIPFDVGFKIGVLPEEAQGAIQQAYGINMEYLLVGGDARFALLQNDGFRPDLSVGGGLYYMNTSYTIPDIYAGNDTMVEIANVAGLYDVALDNPDLYFGMSTWTIDTKVQASWDLFIFTPYIGAGASYGRSEVSGGLLTDGLLTNGTPITDNEATIIEDATGISNIDSDGLTFGSEVNGWVFRAFGGLSVKIFVIYIDINLLYNFTSQDIGASANVRLQFNFHGKDRDEEDE